MPALIKALKRSASVYGLAFTMVAAGAVGTVLVDASTERAAAATPVEAIASPVAQAPVEAESRWSLGTARELAREVAASADEGLNPEDYGQTRLAQAIADGKGAALDQAANASALALARDYALGHVRERGADWFIERSPYETADLPARMEVAVQRGEVRDWLRSLLPQDERYAALRTALASAPAGADRDRIRANMERWRWMPRTFGERYVYVNVPSYRLALVDDGQTRASYDVVVGAPATPTPVLTAAASTVVVNPWWNVPQSIIKSSNLYGKAGYVTQGKTVRQAPGPRNALGQIKIDMPNPHAIYLHDTPSKGGFLKKDRALSHGCIRVKDVDQLAADLLQADIDAAGKLDSALGTRKTTHISMQQQWPVFLVYFTQDLDESGQLVSYGDPYGRDAKLIAQMDDGTRMARRSDGGAVVASN